MRIVKLAVLGAVLTLAGCAQQDAGPPISQPRGVDAFHSVDLRGAAELDVLVGTKQSLVVEGSPATLARLSTTVQNGTLVLELNQGGFWQPRVGRLKVRITLPKLNSLALNGAGHISVSGLNGGATTMVLSGAGDLRPAVRWIRSPHASTVPATWTWGIWRPRTPPWRSMAPATCWCAQVASSPPG